MKRTTYLIPLLWALQWGACYDPAEQDARLNKNPMPRPERDTRMAISAFCLSMTALLGLRQAGLLEPKES